MSRVRRNESDYEDSIEVYKDTPVHKFILKWKRRQQVRKKKKALRGANKSLRSHYYVHISNVNHLDVLDDEIAYELGLHIRCVRYIVNNCCTWLLTTKPEIP